MAPKGKKNNKKKNSVPSTPKENGDFDPLSAAPLTPADEANPDWATPQTQPDTPNDASEAIRSNGILGGNSILGAFKNARDKGLNVISAEPDSIEEPGQNGEATEKNKHHGHDTAIAEDSKPIDGDDMKAWDIDGGNEKDSLPIVSEEPQVIDMTSTLDDNSAATQPGRYDHLSADERMAMEQMEEMNRHIASPTNEPPPHPLATEVTLADLASPTSTFPHADNVEDLSLLTKPLEVHDITHHDASLATEDLAAAEVVPAVVTAEETAPAHLEHHIDTSAHGAVAGMPIDNFNEKPVTETDPMNPVAEEVASGEIAEQQGTTERELAEPIAPTEHIEPSEVTEPPEPIAPVERDAEHATTTEPEPTIAQEETATREQPEILDNSQAAAPAPIEPIAAYQHTPIDPPPAATLESLTSRDPNFSTSRYLSTHSNTFTSRPHHEADIGEDIESRNMASSLTNWYNKLSTLGEQLEWRKGWHVLEELDMMHNSMDNAFAQISMWAPEEFFARKPRTEEGTDAVLDPADEKYEKFWEWKSKLALTGFCANFACREVFAKSLFGLDDVAVKALGSAMFVFAKNLEDEITATRFRHMTTKLLFESQSFKKSTQKQIIHLSTELANALSPLAGLLPPPLPQEPITEEAETRTSAHSQPITLQSLIETNIMKPTVIFHNTVQKDQIYFALFHPIPNQEFVPEMMEEVTFDGMGAGTGAVGLVVQPGLVRLGFPKYGERHDIEVVSKARVVREGAIEFEP